MGVCTPTFPFLKRLWRSSGEKAGDCWEQIRSEQYWKQQHEREAYRLQMQTTVFHVSALLCHIYKSQYTSPCQVSKVKLERKIKAPNSGCLLVITTRRRARFTGLIPIILPDQTQVRAWRTTARVPPPCSAARAGHIAPLSSPDDCGCTKACIPQERGGNLK